MKLLRGLLPYIIFYHKYLKINHRNITIRGL